MNMNEMTPEEIQQISRRIGKGDMFIENSHMRFCADCWQYTEFKEVPEQHKCKKCKRNI